MTYDNAALLWVDIETTSLKPSEGQILELGLRITDDHLNNLSEASWVVHFDRRELSNLSDFILNMHTKNGLLFECMKSEMSVYDVAHEAELWGMRLPWGDAKVPMAGSTIGFDRKWLQEYMPQVDGLAHYRSLDVSSIKLAARLWSPDLPKFNEGREAVHRVLPDIEDSTQELFYYVTSGVIKGWRSGR
jgi:oligoribonuclease